MLLSPCLHCAGGASASSDDSASSEEQVRFARAWDRRTRSAGAPFDTTARATRWVRLEGGGPDAEKGDSVVDACVQYDSNVCVPRVSRVPTLRIQHTMELTLLSISFSSSVHSCWSLSSSSLQRLELLLLIIPGRLTPANASGLNVESEHGGVQGGVPNSDAYSSRVGFGASREMLAGAPVCLMKDDDRRRDRPTEDVRRWGVIIWRGGVRGCGRGDGTKRGGWSRVEGDGSVVRVRG